MGWIRDCLVGKRHAVCNVAIATSPIETAAANFGGDRKNSNVALKIINIDTNTHEHQILRHLQASSVAKDNVSHPGRNAVIHLHDDFNLGTSHKGLVLDVMGADVQSRADAEYGRRLTKKTAKSIAFQVTLGLDYLWKCGVAHGGEYLPPDRYHIC
jgi:serine/threonine protein kinase